MGEGEEAVRPGAGHSPRCLRWAVGSVSSQSTRELVTCVVWLIADVNECDELNNRMSLCKNAKCINTEGSYKCLCLPGYVPSDKPNYCTPLNTALNLEKDSDLE